MIQSKIFNLIIETLKGKSLQRILLNWQIKKNCQELSGTIIDLGSGDNASYNKYLKSAKILRVDYNQSKKPDIIADLNKPLPLKNNFADSILLFNVVYILENPTKTLKEIHRILKAGGKLFMYSPLIFNEAPEPHDYFRYTSEGIERDLKSAGFKSIKLIPIGERFSASIYLADKILFFSIFKILPRIFALFLDEVWPKKLKKLHPCPIGYFVMAKK